MPDSILIVGGGLAGVRAAHLLHRAGIPFELHEARSRLGGRILTVDGAGRPAADGFDLGPSWFWPRMQPAIGDLIEELGLATFPQNSEGDVIFQRMSRESPQRYRGLVQQPESMRLPGGTAALIRALAESLPAGSVHLESRLTELAATDAGIMAHFTGPDGAGRTVEAMQEILAIPPRLLESSVTFHPTLSTGTRARWRATPTWMAPHAKFFALYDHPFWRDAGLSGTAQSMAGPLVEIHDATTATGESALFGFVGIPATQRAAIGRDAIATAAIDQLITLFGRAAGAPRATLYKDWAADALTATAEDATDGAHPAADAARWIDPGWGERVILAASETSPVEPGYLAGAVVAAGRAVATVIAGGDEPAHTPERVSTGYGR